MAFPTVRAENNGQESGNTTTHTVNLPDNLVVGELILVGMSFDGAAAGLTSTWPAGWTKIVNDVRGASAVYGTVAWHVVNGTEGYPATGATISVSTNNSEQSVHRSRAIAGHASSTSAPEANSATGSSANPDPASLTASWGSADNLWFAIAMHDDGNDSITGFPTTPSPGVSNTFADNSGGGAGCGLGSGRMELATATVDFGTFTISASEQWVAVASVVRPGTEGLPAVVPRYPAINFQDPGVL